MGQLTTRGAIEQRSGAELANTTSGLDSLLSDLGEFLSSDNAGNVGEATGSENLEEALNERDYYLIKKLTDLTTSITTALSLVEALRASSDTRFQIFSKLIVGLCI